MDKKIVFTHEDIHEATEKGIEFLVDKHGTIIGKFEDGDMVGPLPKGNTDVTKEAA